MSIEAAIVARLAEVSAVTEIIADRVFPNVLPQNSVYPAIRYQLISTFRYKVLSGSAGRARPRVQVDLYAVQHGDVIALSEAVRGALNGFRGLVAIGTGSPQPSLKIDASSAEDEAGDYEDDVRVHHQRIDFILSHVET